MKKHLPLLLIPLILISSCKNNDSLDNNVFKNLDARKELYLKLSSIKLHNDESVSKIYQKTKYNLSTPINEVSYSCVGESNIYSNDISSTIISINNNQNYRYIFFSLDNEFTQYIQENENINKETSQRDKNNETQNNLLSRCYLKYDFLNNVKDSNVDFILSLILLHDSIFSIEDLKYYSSNYVDDSIYLNFEDNLILYQLNRYKQFKIDDVEYILNITLESSIDISNNLLNSFVYKYTYEFKELIPSTLNNDITFEFKINSFSNFEKEEGDLSKFNYINN